MQSAGYSLLNSPKINLIVSLLPSEKFQILQNSSRHSDQILYNFSRSFRTDVWKLSFALLCSNHTELDLCAIVSSIYNIIVSFFFYLCTWLTTHNLCVRFRLRCHFIFRNMLSDPPRLGRCSLYMLHSTLYSPLK